MFAIQKGPTSCKVLGFLGVTSTSYDPLQAENAKLRQIFLSYARIRPNARMLVAVTLGLRILAFTSSMLAKRLNVAVGKSKRDGP
jgi:hypothetical protein